MVDDPFTGVFGVCDKALTGGRKAAGWPLGGVQGLFMPNTAHSSRTTAGHLWKKGWMRRSRGNAMGRGKGDALGTKVAIPHPVTSREPHIGTDGTFSVVDREHMLKQISFLQDGSLQGKATSQEGKTGRGMKQRNCSVMTICCHTHCNGHEESGRKQWNWAWRRGRKSVTEYLFCFSC